MKNYFVTTSLAKSRHAQRCLGDRCTTLIARELREVMSVDPFEVAKQKGLAAYRAHRVPVIVEHGSLEITGLASLPGALVKPLWEGLSSKWISILDAVSREHRAAIGRSVVAYCDGRSIQTFEGSVKGSIALAVAKSAHAFGWDGIFVPDGETRTFADMEEDQKLALWPSTQAYAALAPKLR